MMVRCGMRLLLMMVLCGCSLATGPHALMADDGDAVAMAEGSAGAGPVALEPAERPDLPRLLPSEPEPQEDGEPGDNSAQAPPIAPPPAAVPPTEPEQDPEPMAPSEAERPPEPLPEAEPAPPAASPPDEPTTTPTSSTRTSVPGQCPAPTSCIVGLCMDTGGGSWQHYETGACGAGCPAYNAQVDGGLVSWAQVCSLDSCVIVCD